MLPHDWCQGLDQVNQKTALTVQHSHSIHTVLIRGDWFVLGCDLRNSWLSRSNTKNHLNKTQDVSVMQTKATLWWKACKTYVWSMILCVQYDNVSSNQLTKLLKKCNTAFSLVRRRAEDCWGEAARWPRNDPCEDQQRGQVKVCVYTYVYLKIK